MTRDKERDCGIVEYLEYFTCRVNIKLWNNVEERYKITAVTPKTKSPQKRLGSPVLCAWIIKTIRPTTLAMTPIPWIIALMTSSTTDVYSMRFIVTPFYSFYLKRACILLV